MPKGVIPVAVIAAAFVIQLLVQRNVLTRTTTSADAAGRPSARPRFRWPWHPHRSGSSKYMRCPPVR
jgi:hypothetical protein